MTWIATTILLTGQWLVGSRKRIAFLLLATGEGLWTFEAVRTGQWALAAACVPFGVLALINWFRWGEK